MNRKHALLGAAGLAVLTPVSAHAIWNGVATEATQLLNHVELVTTATNTLEQLEAQLAMLEKLVYDVTAPVTERLAQVNRLITTARSIPYTVESAVRRYESLYGGLTAPIDRIDFLDRRVRQIEAALNASKASKEMIANTVEQAGALPASLTDLLTASRGAAGQTAAIQAGTQAQVLATELQAHQAVMMAAHYQAVEAEIDRRIDAERRATSYRARLRRGLPGY